MQDSLWRYYEARVPGQVQVVGVDEYDGTASQLRSFKNQTGATYPLLLLGASATGGNFATLYGTFDNYVVVNRQGLVRYHAALIWPHGNRYHQKEIRSCVDSLVTQVTDSGPSPTSPGLRLASVPNPARATCTIELAVPRGAPPTARITVHDVSGRQVAALWEGAAPAGVHRFAWSHRDTRGAPLAPGLYLVRAQLGATRLVHRAVVLP